MDKNKQPPHAPPAQPAEAYDSELDYKAIVIFGIGLVGVTAVTLLLMWWMSDLFKRQAEASDPPASPIIEAREDPVPPGPRLQSIPPRDMNDMRQKIEKPSPRMAGSIVQEGWRAFRSSAPRRSSWQPGSPDGRARPGGPARRTSRVSELEYARLFGCPSFFCGAPRFGGSKLVRGPACFGVPGHKADKKKGAK